MLHAAHKQRRPIARRRGFTLVEMLVVIGIIVVLVALLIPAAANAISSARNTTMAIEIAELEKAIAKYKLEKGDYPPSMGEIDPATGNSLYLTNPFLSICEQHLRKCYPKMTLDENAILRRLLPTESGGSLVLLVNPDAKRCRNPFGQAKTSKPIILRAGADRETTIGSGQIPTLHLTSITNSRLSYLPRYAKDAPFVYLDSRTYLLHAVIARRAYPAVPDT
jgi:prepilin-type N-terminal cleavage/methylation domain-containing protein